MEAKGITPLEFKRIAKGKGLSASQIKSLSDDRLFPRTIRVGMGRGKGFQFYYPESALKDLDTLVYWKKKERSNKDLRWRLWLEGGWDWLWNDVRIDFLDMFPGSKRKLPKPELNELEADLERNNSRLKQAFNARYIFIKKSQEDFWRVVIFNLVKPFVFKAYPPSDVFPGKRSGFDTPVLPEEMDSVLGEGSYDVYQWLIDNDIYSLALWMKLLKECDEKQAANIRDKVLEFEKALNSDKDFSILKRLFSNRLLRHYGFHRIPRVVIVCTLLLLSEYVKKGTEL